MRKILIVEEDASLLNIMLQTFRGAGFLTHIARDGKQAIKIAQQQCPDLILLDATMPDMNSTALIQKFRKSKAKNIPIVFISNLSRKDQSSLIEQSGSNVIEILPKEQISLAYLLHRVKLALGLNRFAR